MGVAETAGASAALGSANPYVLGAMVGLGLLQQRAADERARREREMAIQAQYGQNQTNAMNALGNYWGRALKR